MFDWWKKKRSVWLFRKFERYTDRVRKMMVIANEHALRTGCEEISPEEMLLAIAEETTDSGVGRGVLMERGVNLAKLCERLKGAHGDRLLNFVRRKLPLSQRATESIERAIGESQAMQDNYVGTEHLLLGLSLIEGPREILSACGAVHARLRAGVHLMRARVAEERGAFQKAVKEMEISLKSHDDAVVRNAVAWLAATREETLDAPKAIAMAQRACEIGEFGNALHIDTLAAAHAASGNFSEATRWQEKSLAMAPEIAGGRKRLAAYHEKKPWRDG